MLLLAPLGTIIGGGVVAVFMGIYSITGGIAVGVLAALQCYLVLGGMNMLFVAPMTELMSGLGYDPVFRPGWILHNVAEGGAALGVALKTKNKQLKSDAISCVIGATISGVSEPSIYGIDVRLKKPFIGVMLGGFVGGCVAGIMGAKAYSMGYSSLLGVVLFQDTMIAIVAGIIVTFVVSAVTTYIIGFQDIPENKNA
jgi:Phosphotransferase system IIC components, glucose/maltose/N-acetylglucosamine-specific